MNEEAKPTEETDELSQLNKEVAEYSESTP